MMGNDNNFSTFDDSHLYPREALYLGNPRVKRDGYKEEWTLEKIKEYERCSKDCLYFIRKYVKVIHLDRGLIGMDPYPYQEKMVNVFQTQRYSICLLPRQSGKTQIVSAYLLWYILFHSEKSVAVLAHKLDGAREILSRVSLSLEHVPFFLQPGCKALNKGNIQFSNNSEIFARATSTSTLRGKSVSICYLDELGFCPDADKFYESTYPVLTSGKTTSMIITSTANGVGNLFHRLWTGALTKSNEFFPIQVNWWDVPGRDENWKKETIRNTSVRQFQQEFGNHFLGSSNTLIDGSILISLLLDKEPLYTRNDDTVRIYKEPIDDHEYVMCVDVSKGRGQDYSTFNIIDVTASPFEQVCVFQDNTISPLIFPDKIIKYATVYNSATVVIEINDNGIIVSNALYYDLEYDSLYIESRHNKVVTGVEMNKKIKSIGCSNFKDLIEENKLLVHDKQTIAEMCTFVVKGNSFEADSGNHDDLVMNLVLFAWFIGGTYFRTLTDIELKNRLYEEKVKEIEEDILPFGIVDDGMDSIFRQETFDEHANGLLWKKGTSSF